jgi:SAM-dependent methyltransferase
LTRGCPSTMTVGTVSLPAATDRTKAAASGSAQMLTRCTERRCHRRTSRIRRQNVHPGRQYNVTSGAERGGWSGPFTRPVNHGLRRARRRPHRPPRRPVPKLTGLRRISWSPTAQSLWIAAVRLWGVEGSFDQHRDRRVLFGTDVAAYDSGRPGYPDRVYELLRTRCGLGPESRVVEIGPGTGQATARLLDAGGSVVAVEISDEMASRLRAKFGHGALDINVGAFEEVALEPASFDLVAAATSFHWVPNRSGLQRSADLLRANGWMALWWNFYGDPSRPDPFNDALVPILRRVAPALVDVPGAGNLGTGVSAYALDVDARISEIDASGRFGPVEHEMISWTGRHGVAEIRAMFASFSPWLALPPEQRTLALDALERLAAEDFDGRVERPYLTSIFIAPKRAST